MKRNLSAVLLVLLFAACSRNSAQRNQKQYETVQEGAASGVTSTIQGPGETLPPITDTNQDHTQDFAFDPNAAMTTTTMQPSPRPRPVPPPAPPVPATMHPEPEPPPPPHQTDTSATTSPTTSTEEPTTTDQTDTAATNTDAPPPPPPP